MSDVVCGRCGNKAKAPNAIYPYGCKCGCFTLADGTVFEPYRPVWLGDAMAMVFRWTGIAWLVARKGNCKKCEDRQAKLNQWSQRVWLTVQSWAWWLHPR